MNENELLVNKIHEQLGNGFPVVLVSILSLQGSTPRHNGAKMLVGADGKGYGTIGGSLIEAAALKSPGRSYLANNRKYYTLSLTAKMPHNRE